MTITTFQYKTTSGGVWADVPAAAQGNAGAEGSLALMYPPAPDRDGNGLPCGACGRPEIVFDAGTMRGDGLDWWTDLFTSATTESVQIWLTVWNPRTGAWEGRTGYLLRPTFESVQPAASQAGTIYEGVQIRVVETVTAS